MKGLRNVYEEWKKYSIGSVRWNMGHSLRMVKGTASGADGWKRSDSFHNHMFDRLFL